MKLIPRLNHNEVRKTAKKSLPAFLVKLPVLTLTHEQLTTRHHRIIITQTDFTNTQILEHQCTTPTASIVTFDAPQILQRNPQHAPTKFLQKLYLNIINKTLIPLFRERRNIK